MLFNFAAESLPGAWLSRGRPIPGVDTGATVHETVYQMVNLKRVHLDRTFGALGDSTRRMILARLEREDGASVSELARPFEIKLPAVLKHLDVLQDAGLITRSKVGRTVTVRLRPDPLREAVAWLHRYERFWSERLELLAKYAEQQEAKPRQTDR